MTDDLGVFVSFDNSLVLILVPSVNNRWANKEMCGSTRVAWVGTLVSLKLSLVCFQKSVKL